MQIGSVTNYGIPFRPVMTAQTGVQGELWPQDLVTLNGAAPVEADIEVQPQGPTKLRAAFDSIVNSGGPGDARLLEDNAKAWTARWKMVESATTELNAQYFCWDKDVFGKALLGHIFKKAKNDGVNTRLMVDATGDTFGTRGFKSHIGGKDYLQEVVALPNAEAKVYHPHYKKIIDQLLHIGSSYAAASNHDKILEVDGERAITGGRNIGYEYFVHPDDFKGAWRDTDVLVESKPAADALRTAFEVEYGAPWITDKVRPDFLGNWVKRDIELIGAYAIMDDWIKGPAFSADEKKAIRESEETRNKTVEGMVEKAVARLPKEGIDREPSWREMRRLKDLANEMARFPELAGSYNEPDNPTHTGEIKILDRTSVVGTAQDKIGEGLMALVKGAEKRIVIENPYIVLTEDMIEVLREAGERGVEILLGTNSPSSTDSAVTQAFFLKDWPKILATIPNMKIFVATGERKLHAKVAVVDDVATLVSTYNLDFLSSSVNSEVGAVIWSEDFAAETIAGVVRDQNDPINAAVEYTIKRDADGKPIRSDGKPVLDAKGQLINEPEIDFGPEDHLSEEVLQTYEKKMRRWTWLREHVPQLGPLETLELKKDPDD